MRGRSTGSVVLFFASGRGVVVWNDHTDGGHTVGYYSDDWAEHGFDLFEGSITLENEQ
jgi:hypothetical protein